jgi:hypothetical protein
LLLLLAFIPHHFHPPDESQVLDTGHVPMEYVLKALIHLFDLPCELLFLLAGALLPHKVDPLGDEDDLRISVEAFLDPSNGAYERCSSPERAIIANAPFFVV